MELVECIAAVKAVLLLGNKCHEYGLLADMFFGACWQMIVVIDRLFVCQCEVVDRRRSPLNWIIRLRDDDGVFVLPR